MKKTFIVPALQKVADFIVSELEKADEKAFETLYSIGQSFNMWCVFYDIYLE